MCMKINLHISIFSSLSDDTLSCGVVFTTDRRQSKTLLLSTNVDQKSIEVNFPIAICRRTGDCHLSPDWQSKTLFLSIFDPRSSIVKRVFDFCLSGVCLLI